MKIKYISGLNGIDTLRSPRLVADDKVIDCVNVVFKNGTVKRRSGYMQLFPQIPDKVQIRHILYFDQYDQTEPKLVAISDRDIYSYSYIDNKWLYVSPIYNVGKASCSGSSVTGSGTSWSTNAKAGDMIKFGSTDPNTSGTWYEIASVNSNTSITIKGTASVNNVDYVIRRRLSGGITDWTIAVDSIGRRMVIVVNGNEVLYWLGTGCFQYITSANRAYKCGFFGSASSHHLLLGHTIDNNVAQPCTIEISDIGNPLSFSNGYYIDLYDSQDKIQGFAKIRDYIAVYKERSISLLTPSYGEDLFSVRENVVNGIGTVSIRTVCEYKNAHVFMGYDNVYLFDGVNVAAIGDEIKNILYSRVSWPYIYSAFGCIDALNDLYMLFVPVDGSSEPNECFVYDFINSSWTRFIYGHNITAATLLALPINYTWEKVTQEYNQSGGTTRTWNWFKYTPLTWESVRSVRSYNALVLCDKDGNIYYSHPHVGDDNGIAINAYFVTKDYPLNEPYKLATIGDVRIYMKRKSNPTYTPSLRVSGSATYGSEWSEEKLVDMLGNGVVDIIDRTVSFALRGNYFRLRVRNTNRGDDFEIEGIAVNYNDAGV